MKQGPPDEGPDDTTYHRVVRSPSESTIPAEDRSLLLVDDDKPFVTRLTRAMEARGFVVRTAESVAEGLAAIAQGAMEIS
jgi:ActR/RegA family two-component response regulator